MRDIYRDVQHRYRVLSGPYTTRDWHWFCGFAIFVLAPDETRLHLKNPLCVWNSRALVVYLWTACSHAITEYSVPGYTFGL